MRKVWSVAIAGLMAAGSPALARTAAQVSAAYTPQFDRCMKTTDAAEGVTAGIMDCNGSEYTRQDARLNQAYKAVMTRLNPQAKVRLRGLQRDWIKQRHSTCSEAMEEAGGGTASTLVYSSCFLDETIKRSLWLESYHP